jgi:hypothetical protein
MAKERAMPRSAPFFATTGGRALFGRPLVVASL